MTDILKSPFSPESIEQAENDRIIREKEIQDRTQAMLELGKKCLAHPDFVKYKESYNVLEKLIIETWLTLVEPDPLKYTVKVRGMALQLHQLRLLINSVESDANRGRSNV